MLSEAQILEKEERVKRVVNKFLENEQITINELSKQLNIPFSTIQRDLNNVEYISSIYGESAKEILLKINNKLKSNKSNGLIRGGINSANNNEPIRDENGKFIGNKKR